MNDQLSADALSAFLAPHTRVARSLAQATRDVLLSIFPQAIETAEGKDLGYGFDRGYKGLVFTISLKHGGVNLGVASGASLDDPDHLLLGTGRVHRHIEILDAQQLKAPSLTALLQRAMAARQTNPDKKAARPR
jgi:hypothetical protein